MNSFRGTTLSPIKTVNILHIFYKKTRRQGKVTQKKSQVNETSTRERGEGSKYEHVPHRYIHTYMGPRAQDNTAKNAQHHRGAKRHPTQQPSNEGGDEEKLTIVRKSREKKNVISQKTRTDMHGQRGIYRPAPLETRNPCYQWM